MGQPQVSSRETADSEDGNAGERTLRVGRVHGPFGGPAGRSESSNLAAWTEALWNLGPPTAGYLCITVEERPSLVIARVT